MATKIVQIVESDGESIELAVAQATDVINGKYRGAGMVKFGNAIQSILSALATLTIASCSVHSSPTIGTDGTLSPIDTPHEVRFLRKLDAVQTSISDMTCVSDNEEARSTLLLARIKQIDVRVMKGQQPYVNPVDFDGATIRFHPFDDYTFYLACDKTPSNNLPRVHVNFDKYFKEYFLLVVDYSEYFNELENITLHDGERARSDRPK